MNYKVNFFFIILFASFSWANAQLTMHKLVHVGYEYQNQSFAEIGGRLLFLKNDDVIYRIGASALVGEVQDKLGVMPKLQGDVLINFERNVDFYHAYYFLAGAEVTSKYVAPKIGATLFGIIDFTGGYAFNFDKSGLQGKQLKGVNINFTVNIPLVMIHDLAK